jgi:hypothetical protein
VRALFPVGTNTKVWGSKDKGEIELKLMGRESSVHLFGSDANLGFLLEKMIQELNRVRELPEGPTNLLEMTTGKKVIKTDTNSDYRS